MPAQHPPNRAANRWGHLWLNLHDVSAFLVVALVLRSRERAQTQAYSHGLETFNSKAFKIGWRERAEVSEAPGGFDAKRAESGHGRLRENL